MYITIFKFTTVPIVIILQKKLDYAVTAFCKILKWQYLCFRKNIKTKIRPNDETTQNIQEEMSVCSPETKVHFSMSGRVGGSIKKRKIDKTNADFCLILFWST